MDVAAKPCSGATQTGDRCRNTTTHPTGWCGRCAAPPPALAAYAPVAGGGSVPIGPGPDPLAVPAGGESVPLGPSEAQAALIRRLTGVETIAAASPRWVAQLAGCDECGCLFMVDDTEFLDRFPLNPDRHGNCSANEDCPCHALPSKLPDGVYEAADPATSPSGLAALAGSDDLMVLRAVGANPSTPAEKLTGLGVPFPGNPAMGDVAVQRAVGANPSCPEETQVALAGERRTAAAVAGNPAVSAAAAGTILADPTAADAHRALAANPACPPEVLARIASDPAIHETARIAAAANPNCPKAARAAAGLLAN